MSDSDIEKVIKHIDAGNVRNINAWMGTIRGWLTELLERRRTDADAATEESLQS